MSAGRVAVVVVTYNGVAHTRDCLESLRQVTWPALQVVVVDNASTDETVAVVQREFPEVRLLAQRENLGYAGGNNLGVTWCLERGAAAVLLLNNDTVVEPDFLRWLWPHVAEGAIASPLILTLDQAARPASHVGRFDWRRGVRRDLSEDGPAREARVVEVASGCCLLVPAGVFRQVGLLDERLFLYYEDTDFLVRAGRAGIRVVHEPRAVIRHHEHGSSGGQVSPTAVYYTTRNRLAFMRKHAALSATFAVRFALTRVLYLLGYAGRGRWDLARALLLGVRDYRADRLGRAEHRW